MPACKNPLTPEFYVYRFGVAGAPFFVGIGRSSRTSGRVRYVRYLMDRESRGKHVKWSLHTRVFAALIRADRAPTFTYVVERVPRAEALRVEIAEIRRLRNDGHDLVNLQHNAGGLRDSGEIVRRLLQRSAALG